MNIQLLVWSVIYWALVGWGWVWNARITPMPWMSKRQRYVRFLPVFAVMIVLYVLFMIGLSRQSTANIVCTPVGRTPVCVDMGK